VFELRATCLVRTEVQQLMREALGPIVQRLRAIPHRVAGLREQAIAALEDLSRVSEHEAPGPTPRQRPDVGTAALLEAYRTTLSAEKAEWERGLRRGEYVRVGDVVADLENRLAGARTALLSLDAECLVDDQVGSAIDEVTRELTHWPEPIACPEVQFTVPELQRSPPRHVALSKVNGTAVKKNGSAVRSGPTVHQMTLEFNRLITVAQQRGVRWKYAVAHSSDFASRQVAQRQLERLRAEIEARG
jgi:hypothetical protein